MGEPSKCNNEDTAYLNLYEALDRNDDSVAFGYAYYLVDPFVDRAKTNFPEWMTAEKAEQIVNMIKDSKSGKTDFVSSTVWKLLEQIRELRKGEA